MTSGNYCLLFPKPSKSVGFLCVFKLDVWMWVPHPFSCLRGALPSFKSLGDSSRRTVWACPIQQRKRLPCIEDFSKNIFLKIDITWVWMVFWWEKLLPFLKIIFQWHYPKVGTCKFSYEFWRLQILTKNDLTARLSAHDSFLAPVRFHCHLKKVGSEEVYDGYVWCLWVKKRKWLSSKYIHVPRT